MSVREGQAVVLLCGPPHHYGGTVLHPNSSASPAVVSLLLASAILIVPYSAAYYLPAVSLLFLYLPTSLCCCSFRTPTHRFPLASPYLSDRELFLWRATASPAHAFTSIIHCLTPLNLELTFLTYMICDHAVISKVSSAPLPQVSFFFLMWVGYLWVIKAAGGCCGQGSVYPVAQLWVGSCVCVLLISRPSKWSVLLQPFSAHQRNFTPAYQPFSALCCQLNPAATWDSNTLAICPPAFPPPLKSLHLFTFPLKQSTVTHLMGFALHDNASSRYFKIEKWCKRVFFFFLLPQD